MLRGCLLVCAFVALTRAGVLVEFSGSSLTVLHLSRTGSHLVKRDVSCSGHWTVYGSRCLLFVPRAMTWAKAEKNCLALGGNLASVHNWKEYQDIQSLIISQTQRPQKAWIGGSDAQQENIWLWSDGSQFLYTNWCRGEPNNRGVQNCLQINHTAMKCWDNLQCRYHLPSVCAKPR
uniref:C-type lectin domain-containing protein n=1 Tax=Echeneis naucrates TaxID=173247 RepID=A0A665TJ48_ECHNA